MVSEDVDGKRVRWSIKRDIRGTAVREQETPDGRFNPTQPLHPILSDNGLAYGSRLFSIYLLLYYCTVHAYLPDYPTL